MTAASQPQVVTLRSGDVVQVRQVQPGDAPALVRAYANLGEQSRCLRFFTAMPELPEATLKAAVQVDHENHEALVAVPQPSTEIGSAGSSAWRTSHAGFVEELVQPLLTLVRRAARRSAWPHHPAPGVLRRTAP
jgi:hypothetical protein